MGASPGTPDFHSPPTLGSGHHESRCPLAGAADLLGAPGLRSRVRVSRAFESPRGRSSLISRNTLLTCGNAPSNGDRAVSLSLAVPHRLAVFARDLRERPGIIGLRQRTLLPSSSGGGREWRERAPRDLAAAAEPRPVEDDLAADEPRVVEGHPATAEPRHGEGHPANGSLDHSAMSAQVGVGGGRESHP